MEFSTLFIDLDDTLYPEGSGVWPAVSRRIDAYLIQRFHLTALEAHKLREDLYMRYGTTMRGLQAEYSIDEDEYLAYVHAVPLAQYLQPAPELAAMLAGYSQRKIILTNADVPHARRVLAALGLTESFEQIVDIKAMAPYCKPMPAAFRLALERAGENDAARCVLVDDSANNILGARDAGFFAVRVAGEPDPVAHATIARLADLPRVIPCTPKFISS